MKNNKLQELRQVSHSLSKLYAAQLSGEPYHPDYEKNEDNFRKIVRSDNTLKREMKKYFSELSERSVYYVNWSAFDFEKKASIFDFISWDTVAENKTVADILSRTLVFALVAGGKQTEEDTGIDIGWSEKNDSAIDFLNKHTLKLSGNLSDTTLDKVKSSLKFSLEHGESTAQARDRLREVIDDPRRAEVIAHTESVRAYSAGRVAVAEEVGADRKRWDATLRACPICQPLDGKILPIDKLFNGEYEYPPAHPSCRCLIQIILKGEKV